MLVAEVVNTATNNVIGTIPKTTPPPPDTVVNYPGGGDVDVDDNNNNVIVQPGFTHQAILPVSNW